jgi:hypothetical protein
MTAFQEFINKFSTFTIIFFIVGIALLVYFVITWWNQKKKPKSTVVCLTGGLGTGKSFIGVGIARISLLWRRIAWFIGFYDKRIFIRKIGPIRFYKRIRASKPLMYSNIPIALSFYRKTVKDDTKRVIHEKGEVKEWSVMLTYEHLLTTISMVEYSVIFVDEVGQFANQYEFDNPFVMQDLQKFFRFCRHWLDCKLIVTDQNSSNIVVALRRRINNILNLSNFRRVLVFFYKVDVAEIVVTDDATTIINTEDATNLPYFFGLLPFKFLPFLNRLLGYKKRYDSRCYSIMYDPATDEQADKEISWNQYKTKYFIELPTNKQMRDEFKKKGFLTQPEMTKYIEEFRNRNKPKAPTKDLE